jgi:chromosome segregation protein
MKGYVGLANHLISFDEVYHEVFSYLLGNVVITETLEDATQMAAKIKCRSRIVTLQGDVIDKNEWMFIGKLH